MLQTPELTLLLLLLCISFLGRAQVLKSIGNHVKYKAEQKAKEKIDRTIDRATDKPNNTAKKNEDENSSGNNDGNVENESGENNRKKEPAEFRTYSKFDFVPGDKIIAVQDFMNVPVGDFPDGWNTNSSGDIQTIEGREGHWLNISKPGVFWPEFIKSLPENFTLEFDLCTNKEIYYPFEVIFAALDNPAEDFSDWYRSHKDATGVECSFRPYFGEFRYEIWNSGYKEMENAAKNSQFTSSKNRVKISVWRQRNRLRVYMNEEKVVDIPRGFSDKFKYNAVIFRYAFQNKAIDHYLISNIRFAVGAADTRNKLVAEGKFITSGISFDVNSAEIKPESYGVLKEVAAVLQENTSMRLQIIGHTDADGDDKANLNLSKQRSELVKNSLVQEFGIAATRLETDGKGESQPIDKNTTPEGKANNRRVEFIKL